MAKRAFWGLLLVGALTVAAGCKEQLTPLALNNHAAASNRKIARAATEMRTQLLPLRTGKNVPAGQVRSAYENLRRTVADIRAETDKVGPDFLPQAANFYNFYQGYLAGQERLVQEEFSKILQAVDGQGTPVQKWNAILPILARIDKADAEDLGRLREAQKGLAQGGNFGAPFNN